jgi:hypothetical protein
MNHEYHFIEVEPWVSLHWGRGLCPGHLSLSPLLIVTAFSSDEELLFALMTAPSNIVPSHRKRRSSLQINSTAIHRSLSWWYLSTRCWSLTIQCR